jgi:putative oxidoreductase
MKPILGQWEQEVYALMRVMMGFMLVCHGAQKLFGVLEGEGHAAGIWLLAGVIECVGGSLVTIGLFASPVAFLLSGEMAFAYFMFHAHLRFWPILNGGEIVVANCFAFLYISARGAGRLSVDEWLHRQAADSAARPGTN